MSSFQDRVRSEREELSGNIIKLSKFLEGDLYKSLGSDERDRMQRQHGVMVEYCNILSERVDAFLPME